MAGFLNRIKQALKKSATQLNTGLQNALSSILHKKISEEEIEEIEDILIQNDVSYEAAVQICKTLKGKVFETLDQAKEELAIQIEDILKPYSHPFVVETSPCIVLVAGINGSGKTTTIAKLTQQCLDKGLTVEWAACDTFRAAAIDQMNVWARRLNVHVTYDATSDKKVDPSSVAFKAVETALSHKTDVLFIDTAGRLHNNGPLMQELAKIVRTLQKKCETAPHKSLLILDGTSGQNTHKQVESFSKIIPNMQLVITKLDGTAKAGFLIGLIQEFHVNVAAIGVGESANDLQSLNPRTFAQALLDV